MSLRMLSVLIKVVSVSFRMVSVSFRMVSVLIRDGFLLFVFVSLAFKMESV